MTPRQIELVQTTFAKVVPNSNLVSKFFYMRLFDTNPELSALFSADLSEQRGKLIKTLVSVVEGLGQFDVIRADIRKLGIRHLDYRVEEHHYDIVGAALLKTLEKGLGDSWTQEVAEAWKAAYTAIATEMIAATKTDPGAGAVPN